MKWPHLSRIGFAASIIVGIDIFVTIFHDFGSWSTYYDWTLNKIYLVFSNVNLQGKHEWIISVSWNQCTT